MTEMQLNNWQHRVDAIISTTAKLAARHSHLCSLVPAQRTVSDVLLVLAEADRCVKGILVQLDELEGLCQQNTEARSEP